MRFAGLLYKVADQEKYRAPKKGSRQSSASSQGLDGNSLASPIDLTDEATGIPGALPAYRSPAVSGRCDYQH